MRDPERRYILIENGNILLVPCNTLHCEIQFSVKFAGKSVIETRH